MKHRLRTKITRFRFEIILGGSFRAVVKNDVRRENGRFVTYKAGSRQVNGRVDCFCHDLQTGKTISGRNWHELARRPEVAAFVSQRLAALVSTT